MSLSSLSNTVTPAPSNSSSVLYLFFFFLCNIQHQQPSPPFSFALAQDPASASSALPCFSFSRFFLFLLSAPAAILHVAVRLIRRRPFLFHLHFLVPFLPSPLPDHASLSWLSTIRTSFFFASFSSSLVSLFCSFWPAQAALQPPLASSAVCAILDTNATWANTSDHLVVICTRELPSTGFSCAVH